MDRVVQFRPSRVEGVANAHEVRVYADRLEIQTTGECLVFPFLAFARGREIASGGVPVGELHFSKSSYPDSHFVFYTTPQIVVFMPTDGPTRYPDSHFWRVQEILRAGGFKLYEDGPPKRMPIVLDPRPVRTVAYVVVVFALAWAYALSGFLPGPVGEGWQRLLLWNPHNPAIGVALMLPATVVPLLLAFRHARTASRLAPIVVASYVLALVSEWAMRCSIHSWAALELPPFNSPLWSAHSLVSLLAVVTVTTLVGWSWRRGFLEPIAPRGSNGRPGTA